MGLRSRAAKLRKTLQRTSNGIHNKLQIGGRVIRRGADAVGRGADHVSGISDWVAKAAGAASAASLALTPVLGPEMAAIAAAARAVGAGATGVSGSARMVKQMARGGHVVGYGVESLGKQQYKKGFTDVLGGLNHVKTHYKK